MKKVLVLGAGLVSRPMVRYLLEKAGHEVLVATRTVSKAEKLISGHEHGKALALQVNDDEALSALVAETDLTVSLLPYTYHVRVARLCLEHGKPMVTTSYVSDGMKALHQQAVDAGLLLLNEIGVDPGIDHMSAVKIIHAVKAAGGRVESFMSYCGGLPAPEANDNPLGYKFSWSPKGVVMAGRNNGRYLKDGKEVKVPGSELFGHRWSLTIRDAGEFEAYPNRDSLPYIQLYGLEGISTMFRGTLRFPGWCETLKAIADLGLLDDSPRDDLPGLTASAWLAKHLNGGGDLRQTAADRLQIPVSAKTIENLAWLGVFGDSPLGLDHGSDLDVLAKLMLDRMAYKPDERDMIVLHHDFRASYPDKPAENITSTLVAFGEPGGDSAMARTVSLPAAVAVRNILEGKIAMTGVRIPVVPEIYEPVLAELAVLGIECREHSSAVGQ